MKYEPRFDLYRGPMDGYDPEDFSPSQKNLEALQENLFVNVFDEVQAPEDWDEVIESIERALDFFKMYYCCRPPRRSTPGSRFRFSQLIGPEIQRPPTLRSEFKSSQI